jgi:hypothetical protein
MGMPMRNLLLEKHAKARVWLGELPKAGFPVSEEHKRAFPAKARSIPAQRRQACIEVFVPFGGRYMHGLLGGSIDLSDSRELAVTVCSAMRDGAPYIASLVDAIDAPRIGLPDEYVNAVFKGVGHASRHLSLFSGGSLRISHAVHGDVGSSEIMFAQIGAILMKILNLPDFEISDSALLELFPDGYSAPLDN